MRPVSAESRLLVRLHDNYVIEGLDPAVRWIALPSDNDETYAEHVRELLQTSVVLWSIRPAEDMIWVRRFSANDEVRELIYLPSEGLRAAGEPQPWEDDAALETFAAQVELGQLLSATFDGEKILTAFLGGRYAKTHNDVITTQVELAALVDEGDIDGFAARFEGLDAKLHGPGALLTAIDQGETEIATQLLQAGTNPNIAGDNGVAPIHLASIRNSVEMLEPLLEAGADPRQESADGDAWLTATISQAPEFAEALQARGFGEPPE